jgi:prepilin peptidase CpaA
MSVISLYLLFCMVMVVITDLRSYTIPNWLVSSLFILYPIIIYFYHAPIDWHAGLIAMGVTFVIGYIIFVMRWMGGGDIKLIIGCSLWVGMHHLVDFIFLMTVIGGVFSVALWVIRKLLAFVCTKSKTSVLPRLLRDGAPVPYGVAIASSFVYLMWMGQVAGTSIRGIQQYIPAISF